MHRVASISFLAAAALSGRAFGEDPFRAAVEADWARQDAGRLALIRDPGLVRFVEGELRWPGVATAERLRVARVSAPAIDGRADDPAWRAAAEIAASAERLPSLRLARDGERLFALASFPSELESAFRGDPTGLDAAGAVDGVKDGRYGFHCGYEPHPWWEVDLEEPVEIARIVVYNRLDYAPGLHNADGIRVLASLDRSSWTLLHDNAGRHFGGVGGGGPLEIDLGARGAGAGEAEAPEPGAAEPGARKGARTARFLRLEIPSGAPIFFHLDEVEVYGAADPARNVALGKPARQSSLSPWSRGGPDSGWLFRLGPFAATLPKDGSPRVAIAARAGGVPPGAPCEAAIGREGGTTTVEVALPLAALPGGFPSDAAPAGSAPVPIAPGGTWKVDWKLPERLGFGRNRVAISFALEGETESAAPAAAELEVEVTLESVVFTPFRPERETSFRATLRGAAVFEADALVREEGPAALVLTAREGSAEVRKAEAFYAHPVAETLRRASTLAAEFGGASPATLERLGRLQGEARSLAAREIALGPDPEARLALYRSARWLAREVAFSNPLLDFREIVFAKRFTQETYPDVCLNHMPWVSRPGGDICVLSGLRADAPPEVRTLLDGRLGPGHVHGLDLSWDARRVVFGYARARSNEPPPGWLDRRMSYDLRRTEEPIHIFEVAIDGSGLRQLTSGPWSDLDPTYLPGGGIAFVSERCGYSLQCNELDKDETSCNIYAMRADGSGIRRLSVTKDGDYLPHALADGSIAYTRWEYQERGWAHIQSIWTVRPDGTGADAVFKQHLNDPWALEESKSIPGSPKLLAIATGHHTLPVGPLVVVDPRGGFNDPAGIAIVTPGIDPPEGGMSGRVVREGGIPGRGGFCATPWALSEEHFLISRNYGAETEPNGYALYLADVHGTMELVYRDPAISCFAPIPLRPRPEPPRLPDLTDPEKPYAVCFVQNAARGVEGIAPGAIRYIRVAQRIPWPYTIEGGGERYEPDVKAVMINWTPVRILGDVPVEEDGSAHFVVPAETAVYFQLLDEDRMELRRMRSFLSFQPGETRGCIGCHETRPVAPPARAFPSALLRDPVEPEPLPFGRRPLSFLRDVQPVFDRHCVSCHSGLRPAGGLDFSGGLTPRANRAYDTILEHRLVARSNIGDDSRITQPLEFGSHKSRLIAVLREKPHSERVALNAEDRLRLTAWIDANGPYHGGFIQKRAQPAPYELASDARLAEEIRSVHSRRCSSCHETASVTRLDWIDLRRPEGSLFLDAPLAAEAGGRGRCAPPPYASRDDPDYARLLDLVGSATREALARPSRK